MGLHTGRTDTSPPRATSVSTSTVARASPRSPTAGRSSCRRRQRPSSRTEPLRDLGLHRLKDFEGAARLFQLGLDEFPPAPHTRQRRAADARDALPRVASRSSSTPSRSSTSATRACSRSSARAERARRASRSSSRDCSPTRPKEGRSSSPLAPLRDREPRPSDDRRPSRRSVGASPPRSPHGSATGARTSSVDNLEHLLPGRRPAARGARRRRTVAPTLRDEPRGAPRSRAKHELDLPPLATTRPSRSSSSARTAVRPDVDADPAVRRALPSASTTFRSRSSSRPRARSSSRPRRSSSVSARASTSSRARAMPTSATPRCARPSPGRTTCSTRTSSDSSGDSRSSAAAARSSRPRRSATPTSTTLASLLDKSLVRRRTGGSARSGSGCSRRSASSPREQLDASGEDDELRRRHAERMLELADVAPTLSDDDVPLDVECALAERDDFRAALDWAEEHDADSRARARGRARAPLGRIAPRRRAGNASSALLDRARRPSRRLRARALRVTGRTVDHLRRDRERASALGGEPRAVPRARRRRAAIASGRAPARRLRVAARTTGSESGALTEQSLERVARDASLRRDHRATDAARRARARQTEISTRAHRAHAAECATRATTSAGRGGSRVSCMRSLMLGARAGRPRRGRARRDAQRFTSSASRRTGSGRSYTLAGLAQVALARATSDTAGALWGAVEREAERCRAATSVRGAPSALPRRETGPAFAGRRRTRQTLDLWDAVATRPRRGRASDGAVEREHDADELLRVVVTARARAPPARPGTSRRARAARSPSNSSSCQRR